MRTTQTKNQRDPVDAGKRSYDAWKRKLHNSADYAEVYAEEAAKSALWLQLVEARQQAGLTQQQMAERLGYRSRRSPGSRSRAMTPIP